jgi:predicted NUDIX family NTP pyrophosphohydrolase
LDPEKMTKRSAGILLYRDAGGRTQVLLVHPGGSYWRREEAGSWQIPKGEIGKGEEAAAAAWRETEEELGVKLRGDPVPLLSIRQAGGKVVEAFALEQDIDPRAIDSNTFELEWPPGSGQIAEFPEIDGARWLSWQEAEAAMLPSQLPLLTALRERLEGSS